MHVGLRRIDVVEIDAWEVDDAFVVVKDDLRVLFLCQLQWHPQSLSGSVKLQEQRHFLGSRMFLGADDHLGDL